MAKTKRVVIVLVEGSSDEELLIERLKAKYQQFDIRFECQRGDIFYEINRNVNIKNRVGDVVKKAIQTRKYQANDVVAIVHLMDTDGCFIKDDNVTIDCNQNQKTYYHPTMISVDCLRQQELIINRNNERSRNVQIMATIPKIINNKYPYQLYYFSRNLEHVVFDEANPASENKYEAIEELVESLSEPVELFLAQWMQPLEGTYEQQYKQSWKCIQQESNSLNRSTNVPLLFDFLDETLPQS